MRPVPVVFLRFAFSDQLSVFVLVSLIAYGDIRRSDRDLRGNEIFEMKPRRNWLM